MNIICLGSCHFMQECELTCLIVFPMLVFVYAMLMFVLDELVISLSMLNSTLGTMFMLITSPN